MGGPTSPAPTTDVRRPRRTRRGRRSRRLRGATVARYRPLDVAFAACVMPGLPLNNTYRLLFRAEGRANSAQAVVVSTGRVWPASVAARPFLWRHRRPSTNRQSTLGGEPGSQPRSRRTRSDRRSRRTVEPFDHAGPPGARFVTNRWPPTSGASTAAEASSRMGRYDGQPE